MATRKTPVQAKPILELLRSRDEAKALIISRVEKGLALKEKKPSSQIEYEDLSKEYYKWDSFNNELLKQIFSNNEMAEEYSRHYMSVFSLDTPSLGKQISDRYKSIDDKIHRLDSIQERVELIPLAVKVTGTIAVTEAGNKLETSRSKKVFVVHGHDEVAKTNLEVFLRENGLEPIVLHRQADEGLTIIEKFEKHSDVGYAFILLTPDEVSYLKKDEGLPNEERRTEFRARQNVIFEFGYFVGKLSRARVCCLYTGGVRVPSDLSGFIYKEYNKNIEEVGYSIIKDLRAAGYSI